MSAELRQSCLDEYQDGARGKLNALALVKGVSEESPLMLTLKGMASKHFMATLKRFRKEVLAAARAETRKSYPDYTFWMRVKAGEAVRVGSGNNTSMVTPPAPAWACEVLKDPDKRTATLTELYVGDAALAAAQGLWQEAQAWAKAYQGRDNGYHNGAPPMPDEPPDDYYYDEPPPDDDEYFEHPF